MGHGKLQQTFTSLASSFPGLVMGMLYVWPSYTLPLLMAENTTVLPEPITETEKSLLGSLPALGAMLGTTIVGPIIERIGRKSGGVVLSVPFVISWFIVAVFRSSTMILVARFLGGVSGGANLVYGPIFISEVVEDSIRGTLATAPILLHGIGILISYLIGWFLNYSSIAWINFSVSMVSCGLLMVVTESPVYLLKRNQEEAARICLSTYRGVPPNSTEIQKEITKLKQQVNFAYEMIPITEKTGDEQIDMMRAEVNQSWVSRKLSVVKALFLSQSSRRAFFVLLSLVSMQAIMGLVPVQVYAKQVFIEADPGKSDLYSVIFAIVLVGGSLVTGGIADKAGRRVLLIASSLSVAVCMTVLGYLVQSRSAPAWVTVTFMVLYCFCFMAGAGSIPYVLLAEVFNPEVQALASTLVIEWVWLINFAILIIFNYLNSLVGIHGTFYIFAANAVINAMIGIFFLPETKGLSNIEIQKAFLRRSRI